MKSRKAIHMEIDLPVLGPCPGPERTLPKGVVVRDCDNCILYPCEILEEWRENVKSNISSLQGRDGHLQWEKTHSSK